MWRWSQKDRYLLGVLFQCWHSFESLASVIGINLFVSIVFVAQVSQMFHLTQRKMGDSWHLWQYWSESKHTWLSMSMEYCELHDKIVSQGFTDFEYDVAYARGTKFYHYKVNLVQMTQTNCNTKTVRALRRLTVDPPKFTAA